MKKKAINNMFEKLNNVSEIADIVASSIVKAEDILIDILKLRDTSLELEEIKNFCRDSLLSLKGVKDHAQDVVSQMEKSIDISETMKPDLKII